MKSPRSFTDRTTEYDARNLEAAVLILADPDRFGGDTAALPRWARAFIHRNGIVETPCRTRRLPQQAAMYPVMPEAREI